MKFCYKAMRIGFLILAFVLFALVMSIEVSRANPYYHMTKVVASSGGGGGSSSFLARSGHHHRFICWANPAGVLICTVIVAIGVRTYQEVQKGCTTDQVNWPARLWMPICNWKDPAAARSKRGPKPVSVRG